MLKKRVVVLHTDGEIMWYESTLTDRSYDGVHFTSEIEDDFKEADAAPYVFEASMDLASWHDMGDPHEITVTIHPGDTLNGG